MAAEFHNLNFTCLESSIVPSGSDYTNPVFQTCTYEGAIPGELTISGDLYLSSHFGFTYQNVWRNFGILVGMTIGLILLTLWLLEIVDWSNSSQGSHGLERAGRSAHKHGDVPDEEKGAKDAATGRRFIAETANATADGIEASQSVFAWKNLRYTIPYGDGERLLLNDVSGYCKPGEMTALVGASGAGKSTCKSPYLYLL
jgi:ATP-binding cassette, subfamily G (WHITE), member 2, SNQ2